MKPSIIVKPMKPSCLVSYSSSDESDNDVSRGQTGNHSTNIQGVMVTLPDALKLFSGAEDDESHSDASQVADSISEKSDEIPVAPRIAGFKRQL
jgi:hypothetical protein